MRCILALQAVRCHRPAGWLCLATGRSYSAALVDDTWVGDIEGLRDVVAEGPGRRYQAGEMLPRVDLTDWFGRIADIEAGRDCSFKRAFCSPTKNESMGVPRPSRE
jgi:hypothetical protein